jgi:hypothetical protein
VMMTSVASAGPAEEGLAAYERGDYATALRPLMTPEQIAEAQRLAREWKPKRSAP